MNNLAGRRVRTWPQTLGYNGEAARRGRASPKVCAPGFTIVEIVIVIAIFLTLAAIVIPSYSAAVDQARTARAVGDIRTIGSAVLAYELINQRYPDTLDQTDFGATLDPWGNRYQYLNFANTKGKGKMRKNRFLVPINSFFDLYSMGKDGQSVPP